MRKAAGHEDDALVIGRFQPLHNGHMQVIARVAAECARVTIGIGSAQYSHTRENPFTAGERYLMISEALKDAGVENFYLVPVEDLNRYSLWVAQVVSMCPPFSIVYSNNQYTRRLFQEAGFEVRRSPLYNRSEYSGTEVRRRILEGGDWKHLVPPKVAETIERIDGVARIRELMGEAADGAQLRPRGPGAHPPRAGADAGARRVLHRRADGLAGDLDAGRLRVLRGRRGDLLRRGEGVRPRREAGDAPRPRRRQRRDRRGDGGRRAPGLRLGRRRLDNRDRRAGGRDRGQAGRPGARLRHRRLGEGVVGQLLRRVPPGRPPVVRGRRRPRPAVPAGGRAWAGTTASSPSSGARARGASAPPRSPSRAAAGSAAT